MLKRFKLLVQAAFNSFWFLPASLVLGAVALFMLTAAIDDAVDLEPLNRYGLPFAIDADGARQLMATLAGSLITVASLVFSMTLVALTVAAGNIGARLLVRYMRNRTIQITLGLFLAGFIFALLTLSIVGDGRNVPRLSVVMAMAIAIGSFLWLAYAFHDLARTIQVDRAISSLTAAFRRGIESLGSSDAVHSGFELPGEPLRIASSESGYVQSVDKRRLLGQARAHELRIDVLVKPGVLLLKGEPMMAVCGNGGPAELEDAQKDALRGAVILDSFRSDLDDPFFCLRLISEIGLRALSPGMNDLYTAMACVDNMAEGIGHLIDVGLPGNILLNAEGEAVVRLAAYDIDDFLDGAFSELRRAAAAHPSLTARLLDRLGRLARLAEDEEIREALLRRVRLIAGEVRDEKYSASDRRFVDDALRSARTGARTGGSPMQQEN